VLNKVHFTKFTIDLVIHIPQPLFAILSNAFLYVKSLGVDIFLIVNVYEKTKKYQAVYTWGV
jgi:hypothetical protein